MVDAPASGTEAWDDVAARVVSTRFRDVRRFAEVDSTNRYVLDAAREGAPEGLVVTADLQSAGRGRAGRSWAAPAGASLLMSVLVRPGFAVSDAHLVTMAAGVAVCEAVWLEAGFTPSLKWPNDLVVGPRKLAGMLSEADVEAGELAALVVGIGVNVNWTEFPPDIADAATACSLEAGAPVDRVELCVRFLDRFDHWYGALFGPGGREVVLAEYRTRCSTIGRRVRAELADGSAVIGEASAVDDQGRVVIDAPAGPVAVAVGDVHHLRPADPT